MWQQTIAITNDLASELIEDQTEAQVDRIVLLGKDFDSVAYRIIFNS